MYNPNGTHNFIMKYFKSLELASRMELETDELETDGTTGTIIRIL